MILNLLLVVLLIIRFRASERKRRQAYRGEVHGQLPFDTRGMDDIVPTIDFSPSGNTDAPYSLEREDVDGETGLSRHVSCFCLILTSRALSGFGRT